MRAGLLLGACVLLLGACSSGQGDSPAQMSDEELDRRIESAVDERFEAFEERLDLLFEGSAPETPDRTDRGAESEDAGDSRDSEGGEDAEPEVPQATLTVHTDGCGVIRTEFREDPRNLGWSVTDEDGFEVLQRNASGETAYRYFQSGTYKVMLTAWGGSGYVPVSNEVTIRC